MQVQSSHQSTSPDLIGDYCDGEMYHNHPLFSVNSSALQLMIYYDELELCNPLGSRRKKHKIGNDFLPFHINYLVVTSYAGAFYYLLGNLDPQFRSRIHNIQLLALAKYSTISEYGIDKILEPAIDDIRTLESVSLSLLPQPNAVCHPIYAQLAS